MKQDIIKEYEKSILNTKPDSSNLTLNMYPFLKEEFSEKFQGLLGLIGNHSIRLLLTASFIFVCLEDSLEAPVLTSTK
jgi:hypothetical protein